MRSMSPITPSFIHCTAARSPVSPVTCAPISVTTPDFFATSKSSLLSLRPRQSGFWQ